MTTLNFDQWERTLRATFNVIGSHRTADAVNVSILKSDGTAVDVEIDQRSLDSIELDSSEIGDLLRDKLHTSLLRDGSSSVLRLGTIDGWVGFYDPTQQYGIVADEQGGTFYWSSSPPTDPSD